MRKRDADAGAFGAEPLRSDIDAADATSAARGRGGER